jgi:hypothetical protein
MVSVEEEDDGVIWGSSKRGHLALVVADEAHPNGVSLDTTSLEPMGLASRSSRELRKGTGEAARACLIQAGDNVVLVEGTEGLSNGILVGVFKIGGGGGGASGGRRCKNSRLLLLLPVLELPVLPTLSLSVGSSCSGGGIRGERVWRTVLVARATLPVLGLVWKDAAPSRRYDLQSAVISGDELAKIETMRG